MIDRDAQDLYFSEPGFLFGLPPARGPIVPEPWCTLRPTIRGFPEGSLAFPEPGTGIRTYGIHHATLGIRTIARLHAAATNVSKPPSSSLLSRICARADPQR